MKRDKPVVLVGGSIITRTVPPIAINIWARRGPARAVYLYAIRRTGSGEIKIGIAEDARIRLMAMQGGHAVPLELCLAIRGGMSEEIAIHKRFAADRMLGEWFRESQAITDWIDAESAAVPAHPDIFDANAP